MQLRFGVVPEEAEAFRKGEWVRLYGVDSTGVLHALADTNDVEVGRNDAGKVVVRRLDTRRAEEKRRREDTALRTGSTSAI